MLDSREIAIINYLNDHPRKSSREIYEEIKFPSSYTTVKRILSKLVSEKLLEIEGQGKSSKYLVSTAYRILQPLDINEYYKKEVDERIILENFNFELIDDHLFNIDLFTEKELNHLINLQKKYQDNRSELTQTEYKKELERLAIDLSWKSSQIEGNTYSLLETEKLLKEKETAAGKTKDEASMLLNHKEAIDFIVDHPDYLEPLTISKIEDIHSLLTKELNVDET